MSNFFRFWRWIARNWFRTLSCVALAGFGVMYAIYPEVAKIIFLWCGGFLLLLSFISGAEKIGEAREDTRIYSLYSENYRARHRIPGEPMRLHQLDIEEMTPEELEEARARGWVTTPDETEDEDGLGWEVEYYRKK